MDIIKAKDYEEMSRKAASYISAQVLLKPYSVLGLATGATPLGTYRELIRLFKNDEVSFRQVCSFNLDEYYGLGTSHPQSYRYFMDQNFFNQIDILPENTHIPDGLTPDPEKYSEDYESQIVRAGGIDLQLLGIGSNGHIAFNEPAKFFTAKTRLVNLNDHTIEDNARFFNSKDEVPCQAISMGLKSILSAKRILILASGKNKADAVKGMLEGPIDPNLPASILQLHPNVVLIADEKALFKVKS
jgi:glucosamine-6-phosphate deaminase